MINAVPHGRPAPAVRSRVVGAESSRTVRCGPYDDIDSDDERHDATFLVSEDDTITPPIVFGVVPIEDDEGKVLGSRPASLPAQNADSLRTAFGMKASCDWERLAARLWRYRIVSSFANGAGNSFTVSGPEIGRDSMLLGAGVAIHWNDRISTYAYYDGELCRTNCLSNNVSAAVRVTLRNLK